MFSNYQRLIFTLFVFLFCASAYAFDKGFTSVEHLTFGDEVKLYFTSKNQGQSNTVITMPNGLHLTYGDILAFGDFYEVPHEVISLGKTDAERRERFIAAFNSFAINPSVIDEAKQILSVIHGAQELVREGMARGEDPTDILNRISPEAHRKLNCITGGGCSEKGWWLKPGRYLILANTDFDHFGDHAWIAYQTGHQVAMEMALKARETADLKKLEFAYALNAFASHFLSDRFSSGHIRTPRLKLYMQVTPSTVGSLLVNFMHNEESIYGIHVHNKRGEHWVAYGDRLYFKEEDKTHREKLQEVLQMSANEIFDAYQLGLTQSSLEDLVPQADEIGNHGSIDIAPLFYWDNDLQKLMRRVDVANRFDRHWTENWAGWSTLILLSSAHGIPSIAGDVADLAPAPSSRR